MDLLVDTNYQYTNYDLYDYSEIRKLIRDELPRFAENVFHFNCDVIIPIEDEGLSILIPFIKKHTGVLPKIIPSKAFQNGWGKELVEDKKILLVDATSRTGETLFKVKNIITNIYGISEENISIFSFIVLRDVFSNYSEIKNNPICLRENQYFWGKEEIINYLSYHVQYRWGDPPLYKFKLPANILNSIQEEVTSISTCYQLPQEEFENFFRFSISNIELEDRTWLPDTFENNYFFKVRFYIDKKNEELKILPLFFPKIPVGNNYNLPEVLLCSQKYFSNEFTDLIKISEGVSRQNINIFRWFSAIGSIFLLRDILKIFNNKTILNLIEVIEIDDPIPGLISYSCPQEVFDLIKSITKKYISDNLESSIKIFKIPPKKEATDNPQENNPDDFFPEDTFMESISDWVVDNEINKNFQVVYQGIPIEYLFELIDGLNQQEINRALDTLVDEYLIRTRISEINGFLQRAYAPAGESITKILRILGNPPSLQNRLQTNSTQVN